MEARAALDAGEAVLEQAVASGDVLVERARERDVEDLVAAADREHREPARDRGAGEGELARVAVGADAVHRVVGLLAVGRRVEVAAAEEQQAVEPVEERGGVVVVERGREQDRLLPAGAAQRRRRSGPGRRRPRRASRRPDPPSAAGRRGPR